MYRTLLETLSRPYPPAPPSIHNIQAMARAAKEKTEFPIAPQNDTARGSWHTATAGMYTKEGLAELRSSQAFTPKPSGGRSRDRMTRGGVDRGDNEAGAAASERVFAGDEAEMVHEAGQQGDLKEVRGCEGLRWRVRKGGEVWLWLLLSVGIGDDGVSSPR